MKFLKVKNLDGYHIIELSKMKKLNIWEMMDLIVSEQLETDLETYKEIIENKCTEEEMNFIIITFLEQDLDNYKKAKQTFNKYLSENK